MTRGRRNGSKRGTQTSPFGSPGRVSHDSKPFYNSRLYEDLPVSKELEYLEVPVPSQFLDRLFYKSSEKMDEIPDYSIHLMVTSPPYNVTKEYDENLTMREYRGLLKRVFGEV